MEVVQVHIQDKGFNAAFVELCSKAAYTADAFVRTGEWPYVHIDRDRRLVFGTQSQNAGATKITIDEALEIIQKNDSVKLNEEYFATYNKGSKYVGINKEHAIAVDKIKELYNIIYPPTDHKVELDDKWTAVYTVGNSDIKVGCQTFPITIVKEIYELIINTEKE